MNTTDKISTVEQILSRAAEQLGDVTASVMERYYRSHPETRAAFEAHGYSDRSQLEGIMIENSLYCLMYWFESPGEIEILLAGSVPHHSETLQVSPKWYADLLEATAEFIATTIPADNAQELAVWDELRSDLRNLIEQSSQAATRLASR